MLPLTSHHQRNRPLPNHSAGFSLIEIMVGMVIALLATIVMMNVFSVFEAQKRTSSGGADVQNNGAISLFSLKQSINQAGYGISDENMYGCSLTINTALSLSVPLAPVTINPSTSTVPAGDLNTDTLLVMYATSNEQPAGDIISSHPSQDPVVDLNIHSPSMFNLNDQVIVMPTTRPATCKLTLTWVKKKSAYTLTTNDGLALADFPNVVNTSTTGSGKLYNVGNNGYKLTVQAYAIRGGNLTMCDYMAHNCGDGTHTNDSTYWVPIGNDIVSMRAEYGRDTAAAGAMDGQVDTYDQTAPTTACAIARISAVRLVLVGRSSQPNPNQVTTSAPLWSDSSTVPINLTKTDSMLPTGFTWKNYRYKTFEATIALRNVAMQGAIPTC